MVDQIVTNLKVRLLQIEIIMHVQRGNNSSDKSFSTQIFKPNSKDFTKNGHHKGIVTKNSLETLRAAHDATIVGRQFMGKQNVLTQDMTR